MKNNKTKIIYLIGKPGTGKYTIAQELAKAGFIICDNQLINNPIFTLLNYDGFAKIPSLAWDAIGRIRNVILDFLSLRSEGNYVLTNCLYEDEGDRKCYASVETMALKRGSLFMPVKLLIVEEEHLKRITEVSRRERWKSIDPAEVYSKEELIQVRHPNLLELEVTSLSPSEVAERILVHIKELES